MLLKGTPQYPFAQPRMMEKSLGSFQLSVFEAREILVLLGEINSIIFTEMRRKANFFPRIIATVPRKKKKKGTIQNVVDARSTSFANRKQDRNRIFTPYNHTKPFVLLIESILFKFVSCPQHFVSC